MIDNRKVLALVPARSGSKGIRNKNILQIGGRPLIAYTLEAAGGSRYVDNIVVTTDSDAVASTAREYGGEVPFLRPSGLSGDKARTIDAVIHALGALKKNGREYDILVLLQPTGPLRTTEDIDNALAVFMKNAMEGLTAVTEVSEHPLFIRTMDDSGKLVRLLNAGSTCRRQDLPPFYRVNGCIYINRTAEIGPGLSFNDNRVPYVMPPSRSVDIDGYEDIAMMAYYLSKT